MKTDGNYTIDLIDYVLDKIKKYVTLNINNSYWYLDDSDLTKCYQFVGIEENTGDLFHLTNEMLHFLKYNVSYHFISFLQNQINHFYYNCYLSENNPNWVNGNFVSQLLNISNQTTGCLNTAWANILLEIIYYIQICLYLSNRNNKEYISICYKPSADLQKRVFQTSDTVLNEWKDLQDLIKQNRNKKRINDLDDEMRLTHQAFRGVQLGNFHSSAKAMDNNDEYGYLESKTGQISADERENIDSLEAEELTNDYAEEPEE